MTALEQESVPQVALDSPVADLWDTWRANSIRALNAVRRGGIETVGELASLTEADLRDIRNLGAGCVDEVRLALSLHGLSLAGEPGPQRPGLLLRRASAALGSKPEASRPLLALEVAAWLKIEAAAEDRRLPDDSGGCEVALRIARVALEEGTRQ